MADRKTTGGTPRQAQRASEPTAASTAVVEPADVDMLRHRTDCPSTGARPEDPDSRVERFIHTAPDGEAVPIVRCIDCGAQWPTNE